MIGLKQQDFHSMPNSMKVTHHFTTDLVFSIFFISLYRPLSLHSHVPYCVACRSLFSGFSSCAQRWVMGKAYLWLLGLVLLLLYFFTFLFQPCPQWGNCGETVTKGETGGKPLCISDIHLVSQSDFSIFT